MTVGRIVGREWGCEDDRSDSEDRMGTGRGGGNQAGTAYLKTVEGDSGREDGVDRVVVVVKSDEGVREKTSEGEGDRGRENE